MNNAKNKEAEYLKNKISEIKYNPDRFKVNVGQNKYVKGAISPKSKDTPFTKLMEYKTLYNTLIDLDSKIKFSFQMSIKYSFLESVQNDFDIFQDNSKEEKLAYYYIENALFRTVSLWDILAQLYCLFYEVKISKDKIYYNKFFNPKFNYSSNFTEKANSIYKYFKEKDSTNGEGEWKGNHEYANKCRNKMTHRNSPNITAMSNFDFSFKDHPIFMLKRIIEDYNKASTYISEIINIIENKVMEDLT